MSKPAVIRSILKLVFCQLKQFLFDPHKILLIYFSVLLRSTGKEEIISKKNIAFKVVCKANFIIYSFQLPTKNTHIKNGWFEFRSRQQNEGEHD